MVNVKVHRVLVRGLGKSLGVEAMTRTGGRNRARGQALRFQKMFGISSRDIVSQSYSDMQLERAAARTPAVLR